MNEAKIRMILNTLFMIGALASVIIYFAFPSEKMLFFYVIGISIVLKLVEFFLRFMF